MWSAFREQRNLLGKACVWSAFRGQRNLPAIDVRSAFRGQRNVLGKACVCSAFRGQRAIDVRSAFRGQRNVLGKAYWYCGPSEVITVKKHQTYEDTHAFRRTFRCPQKADHRHTHSVPHSATTLVRWHYSTEQKQK